MEALRALARDMLCVCDAGSTPIALKEFDSVRHDAKSEQVIGLDKRDRAQEWPTANDLGARIRAAAFAAAVMHLEESKRNATNECETTNGNVK